jgi:hypothetical protein
MLGSLRNAKDQPLLGVSSYADTRPVSNAAMQGADGPERKAMNRRVELRFILSYQGSGVAGGAAQMLDRMKGR